MASFQAAGTARSVLRRRGPGGSARYGFCAWLAGVHFHAQIIARSFVLLQRRLCRGRKRTRAQISWVHGFHTVFTEKGGGHGGSPGPHSLEWLGHKGAFGESRDGGV